MIALSAKHSGITKKYFMNDPIVKTAVVYLMHGHK